MPFSLNFRGTNLYFKPYLGRIEIIGQAKRIERIYFEVKDSSLEQWDKPQVRDSKREFIFDIVNNEGGDKSKMEAFVDFCEDTIFEMQLASSISQTRFTNDDDDDEDEEDHESEESGRGYFGSLTQAFTSILTMMIGIFSWKFVKRSYKFIKKLTMTDVIVFLVWFVIQVPFKVCVKLMLLTFGNFLQVLKFCLDGELICQIKKTTWKELLYEFPEPTQDGIQGYAQLS